MSTMVVTIHPSPFIPRNNDAPDARSLGERMDYADSLRTVLADRYPSIYGHALLEDFDNLSVEFALSHNRVLQACVFEDECIRYTLKDSDGECVANGVLPFSFTFQVETDVPRYAFYLSTLIRRITRTGSAS